MKKIVSNIIYLVIIPLIMYLGFALYQLKKFNLVSLLVIIVAMIPFFINFERKETKVEKIVLIAAFTAITSLSRIVFNVIPLLPGFNPATAIIILIAIVFGRETGFMVGALTALVSNAYLSHGAWTPFQMFSWGMVGYLAGVFSKLLKKNLIILLVFGIVSTLLYSLLMDTYTVLFYDNAFILKRYLAVVAISLPHTIIYMIANFIFLLLFSCLFLERLERIVLKYEIK